MFIGHFAVALAAKKAAPTASLGMLFFSAQFMDLLWPLLLLLGVEHVRIAPGNTATLPMEYYDYPISHSLLMAVVWSLVVGFAYYGIRRNHRAASVAALCVASHWVLDLVAHGPDLPLLFGGGRYVGFGLWNSTAGTLAVEGGLFALGIALYLRLTRAKDRIGAWGFWALIGVLSLVYAGNLFGPPPPSVEAVAVTGNATWLFVLWAAWIDRHRGKGGSFA